MSKLANRNKFKNVHKLYTNKVRIILVRVIRTN